MPFRIWNCGRIFSGGGAFRSGVQPPTGSGPGVDSPTGASQQTPKGVRRQRRTNSSPNLPSGGTTSAARLKLRADQNTNPRHNPQTVRRAARAPAASHSSSITRETRPSAKGCAAADPIKTPQTRPASSRRRQRATIRARNRPPKQSVKIRLRKRRLPRQMRSANRLQSRPPIGHPQTARRRRRTAAVREQLRKHFFLRQVHFLAFRLAPLGAEPSHASADRIARQGKPANENPKLPPHSHRRQRFGVWSHASAKERPCPAEIFFARPLQKFADQRKPRPLARLRGDLPAVSANPAGPHQRREGAGFGLIPKMDGHAAQHSGGLVVSQRQQRNFGVAARRQIFPRLGFVKWSFAPLMRHLHGGFQVVPRCSKADGRQSRAA